jgi:hypothetical protein
MRRVRWLCAVAGLIATMAGVPLFVWVSGAVDPPTRWPTPREVWATIAEGRVSHDAAIGVVAVVLLVVWLRFMVGVGVALWFTTHRRPVPRVRGLGAISQACAVALVSSVVVLANVSDRAEASPRAGSTTESRPTRSGATVIDVRTPAECGESRARSDIQAGVGAAILLAGGVLWRVDQLRRRQLRSADSPCGVTPTDGSAVSLECAMRDAAPVDRLIRLDVALRAAARRLRDACDDTRVAWAIVRADGSIDLRPALTVRPVAPFVSDRVGMWTLPPSIGLAEVIAVAAGERGSTPTLTHLGVADGGDLFVDLATLGGLEVDGVDAADVVRAVAASLAMSPFASGVMLIVVGLDVSIVETVAEVVTVDVFDDVIDLAASHAGPVVVVVGDAASDLSPELDDDERIVLIVVGRRGVARATLVQTSVWWVMSPDDLVVHPIRVEDRDLSDLGRLLRPNIASSTPSAARYGATSRGSAAPEPAPPFVEPPWAGIVRVLGPVGVERRDGVPVEIEKSKSCELIVWLSLHRERQSRLGARTAMWDLDVQDATFANVVSESRRSLVRALSAEHEWLGRTLGDVLPLHPLITTDADLLQARLEHARRQALVDAVETLRGGLAWVRGMPCAEAGYRWPDADGTTSRLVILVTTAAIEMATLCLTVDDLEGVFWATGRGLMALPGHEELVGLRMRGYARRGDLAGVRHEWDTYLRALRADSWAEESPAPKLVELRDQLLATSASPRAATGVV